MENAILMASGMGTRLRPLTETKPKPLIEIGNIPMIETLIQSLICRGINKIYIVCGYLGEQFEYLKEKYEVVHLIWNPNYEIVNNIGAVYAAKNVLLEGDCFICESDLYITNKSILEVELIESCYFGKWVEGYSDDWVFDIDNTGQICRIGKKGTNCYNMTGIAYFKKEDARKLYTQLEREYGKVGFEKLFWDDVVNKYISDYRLKIHPISFEDIVEVDTVEELKKIREDFECRLRKAKESDCDLLFGWINEQEVRKNSIHTQLVSYDEHVHWYKDMLKDDMFIQYILECNHKPIGSIRVKIEDKIGVISYLISTQYRGNGYGKLILKLLEDEVRRNFANIQVLEGLVKRDNYKSQKIFEVNNYDKVNISKEDFLKYQKKLK